MISEIRYVTFLNYSPKGTTDLSKRSRDICYRFKNGDVNLINLMVADIQKDLPHSSIYGDFFGPKVTLIPVPRSSLMVPGGLWPSKLIADGFLQAGLAKDVFPCIERKYAVAKSSQAQPGQRPSVKIHYDSFGIKSNSIFHPEAITLIDDVLTKGSTVFAAAMRLSEIYPTIPIRIFTPIRTQGLISDITILKEPSIGEISFDGRDASRNP